MAKMAHWRILPYRHGHNLRVLVLYPQPVLPAIELKLVKRRKTTSSTRKNVLDTSKGHITTNFNEKSLKMNDLNVLKEETVVFAARGFKIVEIHF